MSDDFMKKLGRECIETEVRVTLLEEALASAREVIATMVKDCALYCLEGDHAAEWEFDAKPCPHCKSGRAWLAANAPATERGEG